MYGIGYKAELVMKKECSVQNNASFKHGSERLLNNSPTVESILIVIDIVEDIVKVVTDGDEAVPW